MRLRVEWKQYDGPSGPMKDGFKAGLTEDGKDIYIGRSIYDGEKAPAKLLIESTAEYNAGLYFPYGGLEYHITENLEYYAKEPTCDYKWVKSSFGGVVSNAVEYDYSLKKFYIGRSSDKKIGKVVLLYKKMYFSHEGKEYERDFYDVLVCDEKVDDGKDDSPDGCAKTIMSQSLVVLMVAVSYAYAKMCF